MRKTNQETLQAAEEILNFIEKKNLQPEEQRKIVDDSIYNFTNFVTEAILKHRKSVSTDFSVVEWEGEGAVFRDTKGDEYIDCLGGYGVYLLGHRHPKVVNAVKSQIDRYALHSQELVDPLRGYLSKLVAYITPGDLQHTYLVNCGTEANEMALKLARLSTGKKWFISTEKGFHGKTFGSLSASGKAAFREPYHPLVPGFQHVKYGDADAVEAAIYNLISVGETVAGVIVEPIQGEGGVNVPPADYFPRLREICDKYECLLIVDEVQTGMGRTGKMFGMDHFNVVPDIMTLGKAFGGGVMPIAAMVAKRKHWGKMEENPFLLGSSTFGGNPLCCSAAIAGIKTIIEEEIPRQAAEKGDYILKRLREIQSQFPDMLKEVRGVGLLIGMEFSTNEIGYELAKQLFGEKILVGGTLNNATVIRIEPPAVISYEQIDTVLNAIERNLGALAKEKVSLLNK
ncbi:putrescine--2-oxoglutarate aminotransferase [Aneurinibacillus migulanus]|uniref:Putrescine aminotransferase n=1 Tax=Aneurinibacillus migulanus TaxID=47500 RepID=A0A0D1WE25_ANEMI|nr:putrescine aminotransferase [Aneurinibacillus migulanus]KIV56795.1 putrescine--2-oxoglutarate aminotransferase [Aneurinibacillus migulanus]KIV60130.1 putrescine--2-oxoglutarate aminotransferase [Aneurinibacillus migulanus]KON96751.1 putrescine--2-oxoglutarate aminotransferase [Aneurinibacillus migulanus]KPD05948.1 putrescine--2-oxoglutarate aminotransferase [Aneurinibacillus migulanus]MCP1358263.1 putrescine aminotransferase [Aneurinibacillus migulanus]